MLRVQSLLLFPIAERRLQHAACHHAHALALQQVHLRGRKARLFYIGVKIIFFSAHRQRRKQHMLRTLRRVGNAVKHVNLATLQLLKQLHAAALDVFVAPACIRSHSLLKLVAITAALTAGACYVIAALVPAHAYNLALRRHRLQRQAHQQQKNAQESADIFC